MFIWISELELSAAVNLSQYILHEISQETSCTCYKSKNFFLKFWTKKKNSCVLNLNTRVYKKVIVFLKTEEKRYSL